MTTIGLVACGKGKTDHPAPAAALYNGTHFRKASAYARDHYDRWAILTAKHGLILPETVIEPYSTLRSDKQPCHNRNCPGDAFCQSGQTFPRGAWCVVRGAWCDEPRRCPERDPEHRA